MESKGNVVVTGASTGIGRATAVHLARLGFRVFAGVRKEADAQAIRGESIATLEPLMLDVTDASSLDAARRTVEGAVGDRGLAGLVNNAGIAIGAPIEYLRLDELRRQMEVNLVGPVAVTQAFLPAVRQASGRVVLVSSIGGRFTNPFIGPYVASKFALEAIADALRMELAPWSIPVSVIQPGAIKTAIWDKGKPYADDMLASLPDEGRQRYGKMAGAIVDMMATLEKNAIPPERVARAIEHALTARRPRTRYVVGLDARVQAIMAWTLPDRWKDALTLRFLGVSGNSA